jgi:hypothetical protein
MKTTWAKKVYQGLLLLGLVGAGVGLVGCADEYAGYPGYRGGYYASYAATPSPYYGGYGYPYQAYGPYYGRPYYGYSPYYGGASLVVSNSHGYYTYDHGRRVYHRRNANRVRNTRRTTTTTRGAATRPQYQYQNDDERRYYTTPR